METHLHVHLAPNRESHTVATQADSHCLDRSGCSPSAHPPHLWGGAGLAPPLHPSPPSTCPPHLRPHPANLPETSPSSRHPSLYLQIFKQHKRRTNLRTESGREILASVPSGEGGPLGLPGPALSNPLLTPATCPPPGALALPTWNPARFQINLLPLPARPTLCVSVSPKLREEVV